MEIRDRLPDLKLIMVVGDDTGDGTMNFWKGLSHGKDDFDPVVTRPDDPALIIRED